MDVIPVGALDLEFCADLSSHIHILITWLAKDLPCSPLRMAGHDRPRQPVDIWVRSHPRVRRDRCVPLLTRRSYGCHLGRSAACRDGHQTAMLKP